jgi:nicotinamide-nucleotide amidase
MKAEIVMIGTELLLGQIVDTNASYLARHLADLGIDIFRKTTVGDNEYRITKTIKKALDRCDIVITSGGIGPTVDDKTRESVAGATDQKLVLNKDLLEQIKRFFERRGIELGENNKKQAYVPESAIPIENPVGTAPGFIVEHKNACVISMPGVPRELYYLTEKTVLPYLKKKFGLKDVIKIRQLRTAGTGESNIDRLIDDLEESTNPTVGLAAHPGSVDIRISAKTENEVTAIRMLDEMEKKIRERVGDIVFGVDDDTIEKVVTNLLKDNNLSLGLLETNTGGVFTSRFTEAGNGFNTLKFSMVQSLADCAKKLLPDVPGPIAATEKVAEKLARKIQKQSGADIGMAIVGDEDPDVGPFKKISGNTYISICSDSDIQTANIQIGGITRDARTRITCYAFEKLRRYLI